MAVRIETPLLITGGGPAALVVARLASSRNVSSILVGHSPPPPVEPTRPEQLGTAAVEALGDALGVLRPYLENADPPAIDRAVFEHVLKHHCVADMNVTVYDGMTLEAFDGREGLLADARSRWVVVADAHIDTAEMPVALDAAIAAAVTALGSR